MFITNILCDYVEYRKEGDIWSLTNKSSVFTDSNFISNMLESNKYFTSMGGTQDIDFKKNRRFGMQVSKITCISFCGKVRKEFVFSYNNAKQLY